MHVTMPDESQGFLGEGSPGEEAPKESLVPEIVIVCSDDEHRSAGGNTLELDEVRQTTGDVKQITQRGNVNILKGNPSTTNKNEAFLNASNVTVGSQSGLGESQISVQVGVAKTSQAPGPLKPNSLLRETGTASSSLSQTNGCNDSDYSSAETSPGHASTSFSSELCGETLSDFNGSTFEMKNPEPHSQSHKTTRNSQDGNRDDSKTHSSVKTKLENSVSGSSSSLPDVKSQVVQIRNSIDVRWMQEVDRDEDRRSTRSRRSVKEGMCCCYQAVHRAFLQCVEETPAMVSGLVLSLAFCVTVIIVIPTTRVRKHQTFTNLQLLKCFSLGTPLL